ncbi:MAG: Ig-like domain repeat protein, partial [Acidobacteriota bacterium]|nr:Ig-like domain repeat protein [Acidobacteriota bacterium]
SFAHGTPATISANVSSSSGGSKPQGAVAILTNSPLPANQSVGVLTLDSKGATSGTFNSLPGGTYEIWANYGGDATHTGSHSYPVSVTVTPEPSSISISALQTQYSYPLRYNPAVGCTPLAGGVEEPVASGGSVLPYTQLWVTVKPTGTASKLTTATGTVTFTLDGQPASVPVNEAGVATWVTPATVSSGAHTIVASYSGDASYAASTSAPFTYTVQPNPVNFQISPFAISTASGDESHGYGCFPGNQCSAYAGDSLPVTVFLSGGVCELATGTVTLSLGSQTQNVTLVPMGYPAGQISLAFATFTNLQPGTYQLTGSYSGDANFAAATSASYTFTVAPSPNPLLPTTTAVTVTPSTVSYEAGGATFTVTVTGNGASGPPTGYIDLYADGWENIWGDKLTPSGSNTATASATIYQNFNWNALGVYIGTVPINVAYLGDSNYQGSASQPITLNVVSATVSPDFILAPQAGQIAAQAGSTTTLAINLASVNEFNSAVALSCTPSSSGVSCSLDPSTITVNGQAAATLTIKVAAQTAGLAQPKPQTPSRWPLPAGMLAFCLFLTGGRRYRRFRRSLLVGLCLLASMWSMSCGGKGSTSSTTPPPTAPAPPVSYSVLVTGTANGIVHNAKITVVVQ